MGNVFINQPEQQVTSHEQILPSIDYLDDVNDEDYQKIQSLADGTYGKLWLVKKAKHKNHVYLMNEIKKYELNDEKFNEVLEEANKLQLLSTHANIVSYIDSYQELNKFFLIMDNFGSGITLGNRIEFQLNTKIHENNQIKYFTFDDILTWTNQILTGLNYLHSKSIYHHDLKVENVYMDSNTCRLGNLSLEKKTKSNDYYEKSDLYGFGMILYEVYELEKLIKSPFAINAFNFEFSNNSSKEYQELILNIFNGQYKSFSEFKWNDMLMSHRNENFKCDVPTIDIQKNFYSSLVETQSYLRISLKNQANLFNQVSSLACYKTNIIIALYKNFSELDYSFVFTDASLSECTTKLIVLSEFGEVLNEIIGTNCGLFNFQINDIQVDETHCMLYMTTDNFQIQKYKFNEDLSYLVLIGSINTKEITNGVPKCLSLVNNDYLLFNDNDFNLMIKLKINESLKNSQIIWKKPLLSPNRRITSTKKRLNQVKSIKILLKSNEILCLFNDNSTLIAYDLTSGSYRRDNLKIINDLPLIQALCIDSNDYLYAINDFKLFCVKRHDFSFYNSLDLFDPKKNKSLFLSSSISQMCLLPNGCLVLIQDAHVAFNNDSCVYIIRPLLLMLNNKSKFLFY